MYNNGYTVMFCSINPGQTQGHDLMTARDSDRCATGSIKGRLMVISGPSGTGKSTVVKRLANDPRVAPYVSISATTRTPRPGETHGVEYFFLSREEFEKLRNAYGTPSKPVMDQINQGGLVILEIDVQGAAQVKERMPEAVFVFIHAPDMATLEARLRGRGTDSESVIQKRLENARQEIAEAHWYDYQIINEFLDQTVNELVAHWTDLISQGA